MSRTPNPPRTEDHEASTGCDQLPGTGWGLWDHIGPCPWCDPCVLLQIFLPVASFCRVTPKNIHSTASPCPKPGCRGAPGGPCTPTALPTPSHWAPRRRQRGPVPCPPPAPPRFHPPSSSFLSCFSFLAISFRKSLELRCPILGGGRLPPVQFWVLLGTRGGKER